MRGSENESSHLGLFSVSFIIQSDGNHDWSGHDGTDNLYVVQVIVQAPSQVTSLLAFAISTFSPARR